MSKRPTNFEDVYRLSPLQQGLLFHHLYAPEADEYVVQFACRLRGELDVDCLSAAWERMLQRHPVLRTSFHWKGLEKPVQVVARAVTLEVEQHVWKTESRDQESLWMERFLEQDRRRGFDVARPPLLRLAVIDTGPETTRLVWSFHHLLLDGWSIPRVLGELFHVYEALAEGHEPDLPAVRPYRQYIAWLNRQDPEAARAFWTEALDDFPMPTAWPGIRKRSRERPDGEERRTDGELEIRLGRDQTRALERFARRSRLAPNTVAQGALALLLARWSDRRRVVFGTTVSGRPADLPGVEHMVGLFINTLPMPVVVDSRARARGWLEELQRHLSEMRAFEHTPLPEIQRMAGVSSKQDLFEILWVFENASLESSHRRWGGLSLEETRLRQSSNYPLAVLGIPGPELVLQAIFDRRLLQATDVERFLRQLRNLLISLVELPDVSLGELPILSEAERHHLLWEWNDTSRRGRPEIPIQALFERRVDQDPGAVAVVFENQSWTYREVDHRANRLARCLRDLGIDRGVRVGVFLERSPEMVWTLLAVLKAGGTYVPLDPVYPEARLRFILDSMAAPVLLASRALLDRAGPLLRDVPHLEHVVVVDEELPDELPELSTGRRLWGLEHVEGLAPDRFPSPVGPEDVAYVIFTSGTTGTPKGVVERHRPVVNLIEWVGSTFRMGSSDRVLFVTSLCFDLSVYDIFGLLASGGSIRVASRKDVEDPRRLLRILLREPITFWDSAPAALQQLMPFLPEPGSVGETALRLVFLSGDWIPLTLPERIRGVFDNARIVSLGGATEATVWSNVFPIGRIRDSWASIPYGRPIDNARYYVLDRSLEPCPVGIPGDLYIGGRCLSSGYVDRPALTADRYRPDPAGVEPGAVMYQTGDRARFYPDGNLEFLGRMDHQVKVHGFRIELGEVEAGLSDHPAVRDAVAVVRGGEKWEDKQLVAYYVLAEGAGAAPGTLRSFLEDRLPTYMIPAFFMALDALPVTPNGKLDRQALPDPEPRSVRSGHDLEPLRGPVEPLLAELWIEVLGVEEVGRREDFFELGGDSILSIQMVSRASKKGLELTPRQIFEHPTIAALAEVAEHRPSPVREPRDAGQGPVPLTPIQHWFFEGVQKDPHHWNQSVLLAIDGSLPTETLEEGLAHLMRWHEALRLRFEQREDGTWAQRHGSPESMPDRFPVLETTEPLETVAPEIQASLDLERGPLLAAARFRGSSPEPDRLLLVIHHLAVDGVSWRILLEDLQAACRERLAGNDPEPPVQTASWGRWAAGVQAFAGSEEMDREAGWWLETLPVERPKLPVDETAGSNDEASAQTLRTELSRDATRSLSRQVSPAIGATLEEILLAAAAHAVTDWSGRRQIQVDLESHGREDVLPDLDPSRTVGWLTALFPLFLEMPGSEASPRDRLAVVKQSLRSVPRRGVGYGMLRYLGSDGQVAEALATRPASEISFNYLGRLDRAWPEGSLFQPIDGVTGPDHGPREDRRHVLEFVASVLDGGLRLIVTYSRNRHRRDTIEDLLNRWQTALEDMVVRWQDGAEPPCRVPAEFPLARLDAASLEAVLVGGRDVEDVYPATPLQESMLVASLAAEAESGVYVEQLSCVLEGELDVPAFEAAWTRVLERHPVLRTSFAWEGLDRPVQRVASEARFRLDVIDLRRDEQPGVRESSWIEQDRRRGFDLGVAPLMRWNLLRRSDAEWVFVWTFHHLILDGWSLARVLGEVFEEFDRETSGRPGAPPASPPFRSYVAWLEAQDLDASEVFWSEMLAGFQAPTPLGIDVPPMRPAAETRGRAELRLPPRTEQMIDAFARGRKLTWNTLLEGAWGLLLSRYAGKDDVVFGAIVSGRPTDLPGADAMIGLFIQTVPVRMRIDDAETVVTWLRDVQSHRLAAGAHETTPLSKIQQRSELPAGESLFESLFVFENYPVDRTLAHRRSGGVSVRDIRFVETTELPLGLVAAPGDGVRLRVNYDPRRFEPATMIRLLKHWSHLLEEMASAPRSRLGELSVVSSAERHQLLIEWARDERDRAPAPDVGLESTLHGLVRRHIEGRPDAVALVCEGAHLSCGELLRQANGVARRLRSQGVGPESLVGVAIDRSLELVVALLAILEAGGAYVPLDLEWPRSRVAAVLEQARVAAVVVDGRVPETLAVTDAPMLDVRGVAADEPDREEAGQRPFVDPLGPAYVLFTSGTTGTPKGVVIPHRGIVNRLLYGLASGQVRPGDRFLLKASIGFDVSLLEIFLPLLAGGVSVLARPGGQREPAYLARRLAEERVTQAPVPPSLLRLFLELQPTGLESLWSFASGAETLSRELEAQVHEAMPHAVLFNRYGPTEASISVSSWRCEPGAPRRQVPIGRPMAGARLYVLDREMRPVPVGRAGELCIGGVCLARGYQGRPGWTAAAFVPDPWGHLVGGPGSRVYRTGDRVRRRGDGALEFLGRLDHQVQVRGHRVEVSEIEAVIAEDARIEEVAVVLREDAGHERLVAYLGVSSAAEVEPRQFRARVRDRLPGYMVPGVFVVLEDLPHTPNGKIDRRALPAPPDVEPEVPAGRRSHVSESVEETLQAIFCEVLRLSEVGSEDDFFELGGDSILSLQIVSKARQAGLALDVRQVFIHPTPAALAQVTEIATGATAEQGPVTGPVELTPIQRRFFEVDPIDPHHFTQSLLLIPGEDLDLAVLEQSLAALLVHHDALRAEFHRGPDGEWAQALAEETPIALEQRDLSRLPVEDRPGALETSLGSVQADLSLEDGRLHRVIHYTLGSGEPSRLLLTFHHLVMDGVSWRVLLEDLATAYRQLASGREVRLPAKTTSYRTWSERLIEEASRSERLGEVDIWLDPRRWEAPRLPTRPNGTTEVDRIENALTLTVELEEDVTESLLREAPEAYGTRIDEMLLSALVEAMAPRTGRRLLCVALEKHGRDHPFDDVDLSRTVGWFTTLVPVLLDLRGATDPGDVLRGVKEQLRALPEGGLGHGLLRYLGPPEIRERLAAEPVPDLAFNYLGQIDGETGQGRMFTLAPEPVPLQRSPQARRRHRLEVDGLVRNGRLTLRWTYSPARDATREVQVLADDYLRALRRLVDHCKSPDAGGYTPSDFPEVSLDQGQLDGVLGQLE